MLEFTNDLKQRLYYVVLIGIISKIYLLNPEIKSFLSSFSQRESWHSLRLIELLLSDKWLPGYQWEYPHHKWNHANVLTQKLKIRIPTHWVIFINVIFLLFK